MTNKMNMPDAMPVPRDSAWKFFMGCEKNKYAIILEKLH